MSQDWNLKRFAALFRGNDRSYGEWNPNKPKELNSRTVHKPPTLDEFRDHLDGKMGLGVVPIRDDDTCFWGAIDIDNHGKSKDLDLVAIEQKVAEQNLPLVVCRSKSGGAHLYLFGSEPLPADAVRSMLMRWMRSLGVEGSDCVFPKQSHLARQASGQRAWGNWINLPYFDSAASARRAVVNGKQVSLDLFLDTAEAKSLTKSDVNRLFAHEHSEAPPCLQALLSKGFEAGERNVGAYQVAVYCRKKDPNSAREAAHDLMGRACSEPLKFSELDKTVRSGLRKDYRYKCNEEPFKTLCNRAQCKKLKYGISESEFDELSKRDKMPTFTDLTKYLNTDPVKWEFKINDSVVLIETDDLFNYKIIKQRALEKLNIVLPPLKNNDWEDILREMILTVKISEVPTDSTMLGMIATRLDEFTRKADLTSDGTNAKDREALHRGVPVVQHYDGQRVIMFRSIDFVNYLKATKTDGAQDLWFKVSRTLGVSSARVRIGMFGLTNVWFVPVSPENSEKQNVPDFKPEI
jgi:hypothetical protein